MLGFQILLLAGCMDHQFLKVNAQIKFIACLGAIGLVALKDLEGHSQFGGDLSQGQV